MSEPAADPVLYRVTSARITVQPELAAGIKWSVLKNMPGGLAAAVALLALPLAATASPAPASAAGQVPADAGPAAVSLSLVEIDWNTRLVTGDAIAEITRLKAEDGGPMNIGGATLASAAMRARLIDEYVIAVRPVLVGGGTPFFTALDSWVNLKLVETRTFPGGVVLTRYETRR
ncbi:dihydrofolate reductase family protein [Streptomyces sp. NPDC095613]|uniref:dihydrofolate reductase family protein n=1 Tax=Streptomyces sp. NPDC095613 TaxID=3155540 RepID=UPI003331AAFD